MDASEFKMLRLSLKLTQHALAKRLARTRGSVAHYELGLTLIPEHVAGKMLEISASRTKPWRVGLIPAGKSHKIVWTDLPVVDDYPANTAAQAWGARVNTTRAGWDNDLRIVLFYEYTAEEREEIQKALTPKPVDVEPAPKPARIGPPPDIDEILSKQNKY